MANLFDVFTVSFGKAKDARIAELEGEAVVKDAKIAERARRIRTESPETLRA